MNIGSRCSRVLVAFGVMAAGSLGPSALALAETLWISPLTAINYAEPDLDVTIVDGGTIEIKSTDPGTSQWLHFPYAMPTGIALTSVNLCYQLSDPLSHIAQVRLALLREPDAAYVYYDDNPDQSDPGPTCLTTSSTMLSPIGHMMLSMRFTFEDTNDWIRIGGLGLNFTRPVVDAGGAPQPAGMALRQNFPNPFQSSTTIEFQVPKPGPVQVRVYTVSGQLVRTLAAGHREAGFERIVWDGRDDAGRDLSPGVYFYRVQVGEELGTRTMVLAR